MAAIFESPFGGGIDEYRGSVPCRQHGASCRRPGAPTGAGPGRGAGQGGGPAAGARAADGAGADRAVDGRGFLHRDRRLRTGAGGGRRQAPVRRRGDHRIRHDRRAPGLCLRPGRHRVRREHGRGLRREGRQGHGPGAEDRLPGHRAERLRRRPHPGGRGLARALRRVGAAQCGGVRGHPADLGDHGAVCGRSRVLMRRSPTSR